MKISGFSAQPRKSGLARSRIRLADFSTGLADFKVVVALRCSGLRLGEGVAPKFGRRHAGISLEGAIERSDRLESGVHRDGQHLYVPLARVGQRGLGIVDAVAVEDESADQETVFAASEEFNHRRKALAEALSALEGRDRRIFEGRRLGGDPIPLAELAAEFGVSGERVRQIEMRAFEKVQKAVKNRVALFEKSSSAM